MQKLIGRPRVYWLASGPHIKNGTKSKNVSSTGVVARAVLMRLLQFSGKTREETIMKNVADVVLKAEMLEERGDYRKAERFYKKALLMQEQTLGEDHVDLADYIYNLAMIQCVLDKNDEAELSLTRLLNLLQDESIERDYDAQEIVMLLDEIRNEEEVLAPQAATA